MMLSVSRTYASRILDDVVQISLGTILSTNQTVLLASTDATTIAPNHLIKNDLLKHWADVLINVKNHVVKNGVFPEKIRIALVSAFIKVCSVTIYGSESRVLRLRS